MLFILEKLYGWRLILLSCIYKDDFFFPEPLEVIKGDERESHVAGTELQFNFIYITIFFYYGILSWY